MAELVDATDSKSVVRKDMRVRFSLAARIPASLDREAFFVVQSGWFPNRLKDGGSILPAQPQGFPPRLILDDDERFRLAMFGMFVREHGKGQMPDLELYAEKVPRSEVGTFRHDVQVFLRSLAT